MHKISAKGQMLTVFYLGNCRFSSLCTIGLMFNKALFVVAEEISWTIHFGKLLTVINIVS